MWANVVDDNMVEEDVDPGVDAAVGALTIVHHLHNATYIRW